jgi:hypothetical protein
MTPIVSLRRSGNEISAAVRVATLLGYSMNKTIQKTDDTEY